MSYNEYFDVEVTTAPPVAKRGSHTLIVLRNAEGNYILGWKKMFPPEIFRLVGGGLDPDEEAQKDAATELEEEVRLSPGYYELKPLGTVTLKIRERQPLDATPDDGEYPEEQEFEFVTTLFLHDVGEQELTAHDDLDRLVILDESGFEALIDEYENLPSDLRTDLGYSWYDYGQIYAPIHRIALDKAKNVELAAK